MKLEYKILWFDDTPDWYDSQESERENLNDILSEKGFMLDIEFVDTPDKVSARSPFTDYDLIVIDYNLEGYGHGQDFIELVRSHGVFTEIIFYSAQDADLLWDAVREKYLEGIFIANRGNVFTKCEQVAAQSIKKVLDLENMRGIVMSEVGDIDHVLESIIERTLQDLQDKDVTEICSRFHKDTEGQVQNQAQRIEEFGSNLNAKGLLELCSDSVKKWNNYQRVAKIHPILSEYKVGDYQSDVLTPRNFLAHGKPSVHSDGGYMFEHYGKTFIFDDTTSHNLRAAIIKYKEIFSEIREKLNSE